MAQLLTDREQTALIVLLRKACALDPPLHADPVAHAALDPPEFSIPNGPDNPHSWRGMIFHVLGHAIAKSQAKALHARAHRAV
jgi:hypothetical protein